MVRQVDDRVALLHQHRPDAVAVPRRRRLRKGPVQRRVVYVITKPRVAGAPGPKSAQLLRARARQGPHDLDRAHEPRLREFRGLRLRIGVGQRAGECDGDRVEVHALRGERAALLSQRARR